MITVIVLGTDADPRPNHAVKAPARCDRCGVVVCCPTTGTAMSRCPCCPGGQMVTLAGGSGIPAIDAGSKGDN